jgi:hypothetical protein
MGELSSLGNRTLARVIEFGVSLSPSHLICSRIFRTSSAIAMRAHACAT